jgi:hypothetical protein
VVARLLCAASGAFALLSAAWFLWGVASPGDRPGQWDGLVTPGLIAAVLLGAWVGFKARHRGRILVYAAALLSLSFWLLVP